MIRNLKALLAGACAVLLTGCASTKLTVDDGRKLDEKVLANISSYGASVTTLRPAIIRTAALQDPDCSNQYELPFEASTTYGIKDEDTKVAWVRALGVNENLSVIAADTSAGLSVGDVITEVHGYSSSNTTKLFTELAERRESGKPFKLKLASGRELTVSPLKVCRGLAFIAPPAAPNQQEYHWRAVIHPHHVFQTPLSPDEAAWVVLWTQGLSEVGGARMKTYSFVIGTLKITAAAAIGAASGAAMVSTGGTAAAAGASTGAIVGKVFAISAASKVAALMTDAAANRASLSGINSIAAGVFDKADQWAFERAQKIGVDPRAALTLNEKLALQGTAANAFALDKERLTKLQALVATLPAASADAPTAQHAEVEVLSVALPAESPAPVPLETASSNGPPSVAAPNSPVIPQ